MGRLALKSGMISAMDKMEVERAPSSVEDVTVFKLDGPLTLPTMIAFQATLGEPSVKGVIIDLSKVPHMDSAGLGVLLGHWSDTQGTGGEVCAGGYVGPPACDF